MKALKSGVKLTPTYIVHAIYLMQQNPNVGKPLNYHSSKLANLTHPCFFREFFLHNINLIKKGLKNKILCNSIMAELTERIPLKNLLLIQK